MAGFAVPKYQFLTTSGAPNAGGTINVYTTGTTTPYTIYTDGALTSPASNPLTLDANGEGKFYYDGVSNLRVDSYAVGGGFIETIDPVLPAGNAVTGNPFITEAGLASSTTTDLGTASSHVINVSGTNTITAFGSTASSSNPLYFLRFTGSLTLTYNASSLILPGSANITTQAGDACIAKYEGSGNWRVIEYQMANAQPVATVAVASGGTGDTGSAWTSYIPVISSGSGNLGASSGSGRYKALGKTTWFTTTATISANGSGGTSITATLPTSPTNAAGVYLTTGMATNVSGKMLKGLINANNKVQITNYDNTYPAASGEVIIVSGMYEST